MTTTFTPYLHKPYYVEDSSPDAQVRTWLDQAKAQQDQREQERFAAWQEAFKKYSIDDEDRECIPVVQLKTAAKLARKFGHLWADLFGDLIAELNDDSTADVGSLRTACATWPGNTVPGITAPSICGTLIQHESATGRLHWKVFADGSAFTAVIRPQGPVIWINFLPDGTVLDCTVNERVVCERRHVDAALGFLLAFLPAEEAEVCATEHIVPFAKRVSVLVRRTVDAAFFGPGQTWTVRAISYSELHSDLLSQMQADDFWTDDPEVEAFLSPLISEAGRRVVDRAMPRTVYFGVSDTYHTEETLILLPQDRPATNRPLPPQL